MIYFVIICICLWKDYIGFCKELGYDLNNSFVLFPKNLLKAHDDASIELLKRKEAAKKEQLFKEERLAKKLLKAYQKKYPWTNGRYAVVVPKDLFSIKEEGHLLHHCVGTYTSKVAEWKSIMLFIRDTKEMEHPFYTLELCDGRIVQCRGKYNHDMTDEVKQFVEAYNRMILQPMAMKQLWR